MSIKAYMDAVVAAHPERAHVAKSLAQIELQTPRVRRGRAPAYALPFCIVALRRYLRIRPERLRGNWSWSDAEVSHRKQEEPTRTLYAKADVAVLSFAQVNPGYSLSVTPVRSFESQVRLWLRNDKVGVLGLRLMSDAQAELASGSYSTPVDATSVQRFRAFLQAYPVQRALEPSNAAPGTSDHGRGRAVDFQVKRGDAVVADIKREQIPDKWEAAGWSRKVALACRVAGLSGPLKTPYEPWHWMLGGVS
jgi:hypothetical protein